ncbi:MAG: hypothetical protein ACR2JY_22615 [Chloroflexota bacterium]
MLVDFKLSRDGRTLVLTRGRQMGAGSAPDGWDVLDTASGRLRATVQPAEFSTWYPWWINPDATRLHQPVVTLTMADTAPKPLHLVAYDLITGKEAGRLTLPHILVGTWRPGAVVNGDPVIQEQYPALALSPGGDALLIYQPDPAMLTVVDAARLEVTRVVTGARTAGALAALVLPFLPQIASAKATEGTNLQAVAAPDGRSLYVWGNVNHLAAGGSPVYGSVGLQRINLQNGAVAATALPDARLFAVLVAPDGRSVYTYAAESNTAILDSPDWPALLRRHDATTLAITASRECTGYRQLLARLR